MSENERIIKKTLGSNLKKLRTENHLTQEDLAGILGLTASTVSRIERGDIMLTMNHIVNLCEKYDLEVKYFFEADAESKKNTLATFTFPPPPKDNIDILLRSAENVADKNMVNNLFKEIQTFMQYIQYKYQLLPETKGDEPAKVKEKNTSNDNGEDS